MSWTDGTLFSERNINRLQKALRKYVIRSAAAYIASSTKSKEAQQFYGADSDKIRISYLTVDVDRYRQERCRTQERRLLCVGSLIERKGMCPYTGADILASGFGRTGAGGSGLKAACKKFGN